MMPTSDSEIGGTTVKPVGKTFHAALVFALVYPTVLTWLYFVALSDSAAWLQQGTYGVGKVIQFAFPLVFVLLIRKESLSLRAPNRSGLLLAIGFGLAVFAAMLALYFFWLKPGGVFTGQVAKEVHAKLAGFGITSVWAYVALSVFYVIIHSLLEEYYWRWFVFGRLREHASGGSGRHLERLVCRSSRASAGEIFWLGFSGHLAIFRGCCDWRSGVGGRVSAEQVAARAVGQPCSGGRGDFCDWV
jgi:amino acid transporter